jgi:hypothetical protein
MNSRVVLENGSGYLVDEGFPVCWISHTDDVDDENLPCSITAPTDQPWLLRTYILNIVHLLDKPDVLQ